jgi:hypothetical protein
MVRKLFDLFKALEDFGVFKGISCFSVGVTVNEVNALFRESVETGWVKKCLF